MVERARDFGFAQAGRASFLSKEKKPKETPAFGFCPSGRAVFLNQKSCRAKLAPFRFLQVELNGTQAWRVKVVAAIFGSKTLKASMAGKQTKIKQSAEDFIEPIIFPSFLQINSML